ncbi:MAG: TatD family hydrolase [Paludibacteraceae bacterium]
MSFVDIHTHNHFHSEGIIAVRNLSLFEAEQVKASNESTLVSVGVHPWDAGNLDDDWNIRLEKICKDKQVTLIGECGLDKNAEASLDTQLDVFSGHIQLSETIKKPLIIHCVGCFNELVVLKKKCKPTQRWIVHGFRGKPQQAQQLLKTGFDLSFGEKFNAETVLVTPVEHLLVETDESMMPIGKTYERIAEIKKCKIGELNAGEELLRDCFRQLNG